MFDDGFDIIEALVSRGINRLDAKYVVYNINGVDKIYLENALLGNNTESDEILRNILNEYNIEFEPSFNNINLLSDSDPNIKNGFNISTSVEKNKIDNLKNFLDDKKLKFMKDGDVFYIKCPDEQTSFMIDEYVSRLNKRKLKENIMGKNKRSIADIKNKISAVKPLDPNLQLAKQLQAKNGGSFNQGKTKKADINGRDSKHKKDFRHFDENVNNESEIISEGKLGFSKMENLGIMTTNLIDLKRLANLSGLNEADLDSLGLTPDAGADDQVAPLNDIGVDDDLNNNMPMDASVTDPSGDFGNDMGDIDSVDSTVVPVPNSDAMSTILDSLNSIQTLLPDIRLSEYKSLIIKVDELNSQLKTMGANYLSERRLRK